MKGPPDVIPWETPGWETLGLHFRLPHSAPIHAIDEVSMAKRRNLKKEKALRNEAYARKFRKRNQRNRTGGRRNYSQQDDKSDDEKGENSGGGTGATDD